jgi:hypothetical protein
MIDTCRKTIKHTTCEHDVTNEQLNVYEPFAVCLPFGRTLVYDGTGLRLNGSPNVPDGKYGLITVQGGCIVDAEEQPVCEYTPQPCTPAASGCSGTDSSSITLQPGADNLLNYDASGRLGAQIIAQGDGGITISGYGTVNSPLVVRYNAGAAAQTYVKQGNLAVGVTGSGTSTDPYYVTHRESSLSSGTYNGITVDDYGHITNIEEITTAVTGLVATTGVELKQTGTIYTIGLPTYSNLESQYEFGGYVVSMSINGVVTAVTRNITIPVDSTTGYTTIDPTYNYLSVNAYGSIVGITEHVVTADDHFSEVFDPSRTTTAMNITTTKQAYYKLTYRGKLNYTTMSSSSSTFTPSAYAGYVSLPSPYSLRVDGRVIPAYAKYDFIYDTSKSANAYYISEVVGISDALYAAGSHSIQLYANQDDFSFTDVGILTVELVAKGND